MKAAIIAIGDEILIGKTLDTNSNWIAGQLDSIGIDIDQIIVTRDEEQYITEALDRARTECRLIMITGGLGPTNDDITKKVISAYFGRPLVFNQKAYDHITSYFCAKGKEVTPTNKLQSELPENCIPIKNIFGTASGIWIADKEQIFVAMPGVPFEMKPMVTNELLPMLNDHFDLPVIIHKHVLFAGIGESFLADKLSEFEAELPPAIKMAYLPSNGIVKVRLSSRGEDSQLIAESIDAQVTKMQSIVPKYIFGYDEDTISEVVGKHLASNDKTLAVAESCTGGYIAHLITSSPGSSEYFVDSIIAYSNEAKEEWLGVDPEVIEKYGAVSEEVAKAMAQGVMIRSNADYGLAVTGIAGPSGGTEEKPVGTVWVAVTGKDSVYGKRFMFGNERMSNIVLTAVNGINLLRKVLIR